MKRSVDDEEIIADNTKGVSGTTENSTEVLLSKKFSAENEKTPEDSKIKSDSPHTSKNESIRSSKSKNMSKNRGYNEPPNTIPIKK
ncbi:hypothetical protein [Runella slithyformis]|uniref:Uncharacterized protein n=1 Tax=Runella slithyformis (strain ATCC 29530 / DSM 19594 / LMG 11500 / NCIMB 11436 / LSU 4) TaxID=761193 RepID=A0A7U3ZIC6_RUNSL|nr:hypothetical protein [Runella slithyformis]AEI47777.1 hypothetical protein Runsl_1350 [Runella slithyformis DSM 19594]